jgi:hypothetical protein
MTCCRTAICAGADVDLATARTRSRYLAQLVTCQAINALRASTRRRGDYVAPWLPEPLLIDDRDASADVVLAESESMRIVAAARRSSLRCRRMQRSANGAGHVDDAPCWDRPSICGRSHR